MAVIHNTTLSPTKLELLATWLPTRPWYLGTAEVPELAKAGGFRLDDPRGEVGIEFMVVTDTSGDRPVAYHVPLTYRGAPLDGAERALIGTTEHGVLGTRWVYDGVEDPVLVKQLLALLEGRAEPQAQSVTDTPDPSVTTEFTGEDGSVTEVVTATATSGARGSVVALTTAATGRREDPTERTAIEVVRVLAAERETPGTDGVQGRVTAGWRTPEGAERRASFAVLRRTAHS